MQLLLKTLAESDDRAQQALDVVRTFEDQLARSSSLAEVAHTAVSLAPCRVTIRGSTGQIVTEVHSAGWNKVDSPRHTIRQDFGPSEALFGTVCIELHSPPDIVERCILHLTAHAAEVTLLRGQLTDISNADHRPLSLTTSSLLGTTLSDETGEDDRLRAMRLLGIRQIGDLRVGVVRASRSHKIVLSQILENVQPGDLVSMHKGALIAIAPESASFWEGLFSVRDTCWGISSVTDAKGLPSAYTDARAALAFAHGRTDLSRIIRSDDLGILATLISSSSNLLAGLPDVKALLAMERSSGGLRDVSLVEALCAAGTVRAAAELLHMHHSSVTRGLARLEEPLGFNPTNPVNRGRLAASLAGWRFLTAERERHLLLGELDV